MHRLFSTLGLLAPLVILGASPSEAQDFKQLVSFRGLWKFALGDDPRRAEASFNDASWSTIHVPAFWEDEGYPGYDGFAWYRKKWRVPAEWAGRTLYLQLGRIDDVDRVFINGKPLGGRGSFPPQYRSAYSDDRTYLLPSSLLTYGAENSIAIRVYDSELGGGIEGKEIGIMEDPGALLLEEPLAGMWRFSPGDDAAWKKSSFDDARWNEIVVPAYWESQGYDDYDGYAWYRLRFHVKRTTAERDVILLLGKIDDADEVYLNGEFLGRTGRMFRPGEEGSYGDNHQKIRAYTVARGRLHPQGENLLAVKVHDNWRDGGIYEGPIGFVGRERYLAWTRRRESRPSGWDFLDRIFR